MESLVGQSRVFLFAASPVRELVNPKPNVMNNNMNQQKGVLDGKYRRDDLVEIRWT